MRAFDTAPLYGLGGGRDPPRPRRSPPRPPLHPVTSSWPRRSGARSSSASGERAASSSTSPSTPPAASSTPAWPGWVRGARRHRPRARSRRPRGRGPRRGGYQHARTSSATPGAIGDGVVRVPTCRRRWPRSCREADLDCALLAGRWTLLDRSGARRCSTSARHAFVPVLAGGVFNSGLLAAPRPRRLVQLHARPTTTRVQRAADPGRRVRPATGRPADGRHPVPPPASGAWRSCSAWGSAAEVNYANLRSLAAPLPEELWEELG